MAQIDQIPVILLAFANERHSDRYLRHLMLEMKRLLAVLEPAVQLRRCHIKVLPAASAEDIIEIFKMNGMPAVYKSFIMEVMRMKMNFGWNLKEEVIALFFYRLSQISWGPTRAEVGVFKWLCTKSMHSCCLRQIFLLRSRLLEQ